MRVIQLYRPDVHACSPDDTLGDVAQQMSRHEIGVLAVSAEGRLVGVISERDIVHAIAAGADPTTSTAGAHASKDVLVAAETDESTALARRMLDAGIRHVPVVRDERVIGIVSMRDLLAVEVWA